MQRGCSANVHSAGVSTNRGEVLDRLSLRRWIPMIGVGGIVKWLRSAAIRHSVIGAVRHQEFRERTLKGGRGHVERRIARVHVMPNLFEKESQGVESCRTDRRRGGGESRIVSQTTRNFIVVTGHDQLNEIQERWLHYVPHTCDRCDLV
jgi:hypothetical protein